MEDDKHDWECISPGMYDFTYRCRKCGKVHVESIDIPETELPTNGCKGKSNGG